MTASENFLVEVMDFLTDEQIRDLTDKAGVIFPIENSEWKDICYICAWVGLSVRLPTCLHNRMMLGEQNEWTRIYSKSLSYIKSDPEWIRPEEYDLGMLNMSNLAG